VWSGNHPWHKRSEKNWRTSSNFQKKVKILGPILEQFTAKFHLGMSRLRLKNRVAKSQKNMSYHLQQPYTSETRDIIKTSSNQTGLVGFCFSSLGKDKNQIMNTIKQSNNKSVWTGISMEINTFWKLVQLGWALMRLYWLTSWILDTWGPVARFGGFLEKQQ
jgi:hypothetical protein